MSESTHLQRSLVEFAIHQINAGVIIIDPEFTIVYWNRFMEIHSGRTATEVIGRHMTEVFPEAGGLWLEKKIGSVFSMKNLAFSAWQQRPYLFKFPSPRAVTGQDRHMLQNCTIYPVLDDEGNVTHACLTLFDVTETANFQRRLQQQKNELAELLERLKEAQTQLLQAEKMSSIGQLSAGIAHEINNPVSFVRSNVGTLQRYVDDLLELVALYEQQEPLLGDAPAAAQIAQHKQRIDLDYLKQDVRDMMSESLDGIERVQKIVMDLRNFSHIDDSVWQVADLHQGIESTLNIVWNEIKYKTQVIKEYGEIPLIECIPSQVNQVLMNLLINASHAIAERGTITIRTGRSPGGAWVEIADTGCGIEEKHLTRIFEPFFTTKPVGKGTGLGLSVSYGIVKRHHGRLEVCSALGKGTTFRLWLPERRSAAQEPSAAPPAA